MRGYDHSILIDGNFHSIENIQQRICSHLFQVNRRNTDILICLLDFAPILTLINRLYNGWLSIKHRSWVHQSNILTFTHSTN